jgi:hypothetical protein
MVQHHKICKVLCKREDSKHNKLHGNLNESLLRTTSLRPQDWTNLSQVSLWQWKWPKHLLFWKPNSKSFLMLVVFTLHPTWPSYFQSILCIWPKCFIGRCRGKCSNKMSFLKFIKKKKNILYVDDV